jgi:hypothetical protein
VFPGNFQQTIRHSQWWPLLQARRFDRVSLDRTAIHIPYLSFGFLCHGREQQGEQGYRCRGETL